jgi:hypothetical protein
VCRFVRTGDHAQDRGLAGAGWTRQREAFAGRDLKPHVELEVTERRGQISV